MLGYENHGVLSFSIGLDYGGSVQSFGGVVLGKENILQLFKGLQRIGFESWESLRGTLVRVKREDGVNRGKIVAIGHVLEDKWFPKDDKMDCTCGEPHISSRICHHYNKKPCHVKDEGIACPNIHSKEEARNCDGCKLFGKMGVHSFTCPIRGETIHIRAAVPVQVTPSERIRKIMIEKYGTPIVSRQISSILEFLDEEWEKMKPCKHESSYQVEGIGDVYYNVCNDCGVLFLAGK